MMIAQRTLSFMWGFGADLDGCTKIQTNEGQQRVLVTTNTTKSEIDADRCILVATLSTLSSQTHSKLFCTCHISTALCHETLEVCFTQKTIFGREVPRRELLWLHLHLTANIVRF